MPSITFDLSASHVDRLVDAFCGIQDYDNNAEEGESRNNFAMRILREHFVRQVRRWEQKVAQDAATAILTNIDVS